MWEIILAEKTKKFRREMWELILTEKTKKLREMRDNKGRIDNKKNHISEKVQIPSVQNKGLCLYMHCKYSFFFQFFF